MGKNVPICWMYFASESCDTASLVSVALAEAGESDVFDSSAYSSSCVSISSVIKRKTREWMLRDKCRGEIQSDRWEQAQQVSQPISTTQHLRRRRMMQKGGSAVKGIGTDPIGWCRGGFRKGAQGCYVQAQQECEASEVEVTLGVELGCQGTSVPLAGARRDGGRGGRIGPVLGAVLEFVEVARCGRHLLACVDEEDSNEDERDLEPVLDLACRGRGEKAEELPPGREGQRGDEDEEEDDLEQEDDEGQQVVQRHGDRERGLQRRSSGWAVRSPRRKIRKMLVVWRQKMVLRFSLSRGAGSRARVSPRRPCVGAQAPRGPCCRTGTRVPMTSPAMAAHRP